MKKHYSCAVLVLVAAACLADSQALDFNSYSEGSGAEIGRNCAIASDNAGIAHVVWTRDLGAGGREIKYSLHAEGGALAGGHRVGTFPAETAPQHLDLAVDKFGIRHLVYIQANGVLVHRSSEPGTTSWAIRTIDSAADADPQAGCSIEASKDGQLMGIAYTGANGRLKYAESADGANTWTVSFATDQDDTGYHPSLALDGPAANPIAIAHFDDTLDNLEVTEFIPGAGGGPWVTRIADTQTSSGRHNSIVRLASGEIAISYNIAIGAVSELRYAERVRGQYTITTIDSSENYGTPPAGGAFLVATRTALRLDARGRPMIAYAQGRLAVLAATTEKIRFARYVPGLDWQLHDVQATSGGLNGGLDGLDMTTNGAGDPTVLFESDGGTDSTLFLARPTTRPFVFNSPEFNFGAATGYSAPSVAAAPDGTIYTVFTTLAASITRFYLYIDRAGEREAVQIPNGDFRRVNATATTITPDGTVHIFSLQTNSPSASRGDLHHATYRDGSVSSNGKIADASPVPPAVGTTPNGVVHLAFVHESGDLLYLTKSPGSNDFEQRHSAGIGGGHGIGLAVRQDGGAAMSYVHPGTRQVRVISNIDRNGALLNFFAEEVAYFPGAGDPAPKNAAIALTNDGTPRVFFGLATTVRLARPTSFGSPSYTSSQVAGGLFDAYVTLHIDGCGNCKALASSEDDGGTTRYLKFTDSGALQEFNTFHRPGRLPYTYTHQSYITAPQMSSTLDRHGFPIAVVSIVGDGTVRERVLISQLADGIDDDDDGVPLIHENAFVMMPDFRDQELLPTIITQSLDPGSRHDFYYRRPEHAALRETLSNGSVYGEFECTVVVSTDLRCFYEPISPSFPTGAIVIGGAPQNQGGGISINNLRVIFNAPFAENVPQAYVRMRVVRRR